MTTDRDFDVIARAWLDLMPDEAPDRTVAVVLQAVETTPQVRRPIRWPTWRSSTMNRLPIALGAAAVVVVAGTVLLSRAGTSPPVGASPLPAATTAPTASAASPSSSNASGALREDRAPTSTTAYFVPRFEYVLPIETGLRPAFGGPLSQTIAWIDGPDVHPSGYEDLPYGGQAPESGDVRGIEVAATRTPWSHSSAGRFFLRTAPAEFLEDLRTTAGVPMEAVTQTTLDGRPALTAALLPVAINDIHVWGSITGLTGGEGFVPLYTPARLTVADIDGTTVFVLVWARTANDLGAWLPTGNRFVASIHFLPEETRP